MSDAYSRSRLLMSPGDTALLIVDAQEKLLSVIPHRDRLIWNLTRLLAGAQILQVPCLATEQYPEKLGATVGELQQFVEPLAGKLTFSCCGQAEFIEQLKSIEAQKVVVAGIEAHVCVMQTSLDLLSEGYEVYVPVDAVGSRYEVDCVTAQRRMESSGATLVTTEMALFEWCREAGRAPFKQISQLVRQSPPADSSSSAK